MSAFTSVKALWSCTVLFAAALLFSLGCGRGAVRLSLDREVAHQSLLTFLESWKQGERPEGLKQRSPAIVAGDWAWESGQRIISYRIVGDPTDDGANLHSTVEVTTEGARGRRKKEQITYIVGTSPVITIFRN